MRLLAVALVLSFTSLAFNASKGQAQSVDTTNPRVHAELVRVKAFLAELRLAEEIHYVEKHFYTDSLPLLRVTEAAYLAKEATGATSAAKALVMSVPDGVTISSWIITPRKNGWVAVVTSALLGRTRCAIAVSAVNPVVSSTREGQIACGEGP